MSTGRVTTADFRRMKQEGRPITMLTAYDYPMACLVDEAGIDAVLVGDSLGNVVLGYDNTIPVTMDDMVHHVRAVARGAQRAMVIGDLPFLSYHLSREETLRNAGRLLQEGGAQAVKLEGGRDVAETVRAVVAAGIPVMGHIGLTPQSVYQLGGYRVQGRDAMVARCLLEDARALSQAGIFALVLECVPTPLARMITEEIEVPTIGIGAGPYCDGQVLVTHDMLGYTVGGFMPKFVKKYADVAVEIRRAVEAFRDEVRERKFPTEEHGYTMPEEEVEKLKQR
ncbi:MAG: 3-methyl-2-oxobutanoate hydroxymethyltransferase [Peptococcaceae bacterium]|nr:3-methyl-2-oxobutanoate hydroxymethyltransferase [Peptococcaceae bacterium]